MIHPDHYPDKSSPSDISKPLSQGTPKEKHTKLEDPFNRPLLNLRIAVNHTCNLHCPYCHQEGEDSPEQDMTPQEITRIAQIATGLGIHRVKITGGEPLLRKEIVEIVQSLSFLPITDLSMTTNGTFLSRLASSLKQAGLHRVNISLPSLQPQRYYKLMGGDLAQVLHGIQTAHIVGLSPVKLNMLVLKDINTDEIEALIAFARANKAQLQLIELEPLTSSPAYFSRHYQPLDQIEHHIAQSATRTRVRVTMQNRRIYELPGVSIEILRPYENSHFCAGCTRIRITSDGHIKPCLMRNDNLIDILTPLRQGASDTLIRQYFHTAIATREPFYQ